jgi:hypothetical protein
MTPPKTPARRGRRRRPESTLVRDLAAFVRRYVVMTPEQLIAVALWVIHTYAVDAADQTPYLAVTSPEKQCGKTRLLETLELLCLRPWMNIVPSAAVLFRRVHSVRPTLLLDETDTIFNPRTADRHEDHRALLNAGHRRGAKVPRCVGSSNKVEEFRVFCPKVLAGIGTLPDTIADRSLPIRLSRRTRAEAVERWRQRDAEQEALVLRERIEAWTSVDGRMERLREARPTMPDELSDRMQDGCEPLLAIADDIGCGAEARAALVLLLTTERLDDQETMRLRLLSDLRSIFEARGDPKAIKTGDLLVALMEIEEAPWRNYYNRTFDARDLAALLHHYGIKPTTVRPPARTRAEREKAKPAKGYRRDDLYEAWERYL